jgi:hypothetical protein
MWIRDAKVRNMAAAGEQRHLEAAVIQRQGVAVLPPDKFGPHNQRAC